MSQAALWNGYMRGYDFLTKVDGYAENLRDIASALDVRPGEHVLDAGSGTGNLSIHLKARGAHVTSCDFSANALDAHRSKDPKALLIHASLEEPLPFPDGAFDAICCASVLFALSERGCRLALSEFRRTLKDGGRLVVTVPAKEASLLNLVRMHRASTTRRNGPVLGSFRFLTDLPALGRVLYYNRCLFRLPDWQGFHRFKEDELCRMVSAAGLEVRASRRTYGSCFTLIEAQKGLKALASGHFEWEALPSVAQG